MARRVYFAFHYDDVANFRANVVRKSWQLNRNRQDAGFFDSSLWEKVKKESDLAIKRMINQGLENTSVTAVLTGTETYQRPWVRYEIINSFLRGNGLLTIHINKIPDKNKSTCGQGSNPLDFFYFRILEDGKSVALWEYDLQMKEWKLLQNILLRDVKHDLGSLSEGRFSQIFKAYDWVSDNGYDNLGKWVEAAAKKAGR